ncbi:MAG: polyphenol oxidase family protein [Solirubrobacterales bacterium]
MFEVDLPGARVVFTTRLGGGSKGAYASRNLGIETEDDPEVVRANLAETRAGLGLPEVQLLHQIHGADIRSIDRDTVGSVPLGDGAVVTERNLPVLISGADCPAVVIASSERLVALHCGWRSVAAGIIEAAVERLAGERFSAVIGPGICQDHFEVGAEVVEQMGAHGPNFTEGRQFDLRGLIRHRLDAAGAASIHQVERCTHCEPELFYSFRRDGDPTGRQAAIAWRI